MPEDGQSRFINTAKNFKDIKILFNDMIKAMKSLDMKLY